MKLYIIMLHFTNGEQTFDTPYGVYDSEEEAKNKTKELNSMEDVRDFSDAECIEFILNEDMKDWKKNRY